MWPASVVALVASAAVGGSSGSFWTFLLALAFSMLCLGATYWLLVAGPRP
jgi:uncharacterized membrane protein